MSGRNVPSRRLIVDITPLRESPRFRILYLGQLLAHFGRKITVVAVPYQVFLLTGSTLAVGALGIAQFIPLMRYHSMRGRLSAVHTAIVGGEPRPGDLEAGAVASLTSVRFSMVSGRIACVIGALAIARFMPQLWGYRDEATPPP